MAQQNCEIIICFDCVMNIMPCYVILYNTIIVTGYESFPVYTEFIYVYNLCW